MMTRTRSIALSVVVSALTLAWPAAQLSPLWSQTPAAVKLGAQVANARDVHVAGALFEARVPRGQCAEVQSASIAGEPLHFHHEGDTLVAIAAVPIDSARGISLRLVCAGGDSSIMRLATQAGSYRMERLRVAPAFSAPPSAALAKRMAQESAKAATVSRNAHDTPRLWSEPFIVPRDSRITSEFGSGRTFNNVVTSRHMGTDYAGAVGAPVRAANRGIVRLIGAFYLGGNVIYIDHGEGLVTAYLHLSKQLVAVGDTVQRGAVVGNVGATGRVTGPHLHFIVRYGSITVDAASLKEVN